MGRLGSFVAFALPIGGLAHAHENEIDLGHLVSLAMERNPQLVALRFARRRPSGAELRGCFLTR